LEEAGTFLEVAVALPVQGTFTYRDPRPGARAPIGAQVVVPFGSRTVTGFVVARAAAAPAGDTETKDIEQIVAGDPAFDEAMISFGRWVADYYQAPLGEVLRAALPQGEQASAKRAVRLTALGTRELERQPALIPGASRADPVLVALAGAGGELPLRRLVRVVPRAAHRLASLVEAGLIETGDEVQNRRPPPTVAYARATGAPATALPKRAAVKRALADKLVAAGAAGAAGDGLLVSSLSASERTALRALVAAGLARIEHREIARAPEARTVTMPAGITLLPAQAHAVDTLVAALAGGFGRFLLQGITGS
jgi:primosomal protein N' (replication factor Y)